MSKILPATCVGGVVTADGIPLPGATIHSEGVAQSDGIAILDEDRADYIAKTTPDVKTLIEKMISVLDQVKAGLDKTADALTALDTAGFLIAADAGVPSPPVAGADITGITSASTQINTLKTELNTLKEALR